VSVQDNLRAVRRFLNLNTFDSDTVTIVGLLAGHFQTDLLSKLLDTAIVRPDLSWSNKTAKSLDHLCTFALADCNRKRWDEAKHCISQLQSAVLANYKNKAQGIQKKNKVKKHKIDGQRLERLATPEVLKGSVKQAMMELYRLQQKYLDMNCSMSEGDKVLANTLVVGIIWLNGFAGRCGEWKVALKSHFEEQILRGLYFILCSKHKTPKYFGELAKSIFPGTAKALQSLPGIETSLLLEPMRQGTPEVSVHKALHKFGELFFRQGVKSQQRPF